ncbi:MAG: hypothetical protein AAGC55_24180, partial [Myxococcota bacterium]
MPDRPRERSDEAPCPATVERIGPARASAASAATASATTAGANTVGIAAAEAELLGRGAVIGRFLVTGTLGAGGMGIVYSAYDPDLERKVAVKLLRPQDDPAADGPTASRLWREAQALAR